MFEKIDKTKPGEVLLYPEVERLAVNEGREPVWVAIYVRDLQFEEEMNSCWKRFGIEEIYNCVGKEGCMLYLESRGLKFREIPFEPDWTAIVSDGVITPFFRLSDCS